MFAVVFVVLLAVSQTAQQRAIVRSPSFEVVAPHGWTVMLGSPGIVVLQHATGASLRVTQERRQPNLETYARNRAEGLMSPLGFAKFDRPRHFKGQADEFFQYEIRGNRLSERRRILYRAILRNGNVFDVVYENSEEAFEALVSEAESIAASLQEIVKQERLPAPRRQSLK